MTEWGDDMNAGRHPHIRLPRKNEYQLRLEVPGYRPQTVALTRGTNGWIFGNLVVGWLLGFAIDFATGSAYKLEPSLVQVTMQRDQTGDATTLIPEWGDPEKSADEKT